MFCKDYTIKEQKKLKPYDIKNRKGLSMKVYIHTDLEGVCDFYNWDEADIPTSRGVGYTKEFLTQEVNAAIEGICSVAPNAEIVVEDGHGGGYYGPNILAEKLNRQAKLVVGRFNSHLSTIDAEFDLFMIIGAHAMAGTARGQMNHTLSKNTIYNVLLNKKPIGEIGICAAIAGYYNVPFALASGDYWAMKEAEELMENLETVAVKKGLNSYCAECLNPDVARELIRDAAKKAASSKHIYKPYKIQGRIEVQIDYFHTEHADEAERKNSGKRIGGRSVMFEGDDLRQLFNRCF